MADAVGAHNGRVFGDMGDGVAAAFESATDAALAALEMQANAEATGLTNEPTIQLRVGVHEGDVVRNGDGFIGMSVHVASRLCDAAPNGHIAASGAFSTALGATGGIRVTPYESRVMKGIAEPLEVCLITDPARLEPIPTSRSASSTWGIPSTPWLTERSAPRLMVGREEEQSRLENLGVASVERTQLALIDGEAGIGKSTLLHSCGAHFAAEGRLCVIGRADETQPAPYREFIEALTHVIPYIPDETIADHVLRHGHLLGRLVPVLGHRSQSLDAGRDGDDPDRFRLFEAVADLLRSITTHQPMVILLEDLHWSAEPTLALIRHLTLSVQLPSLLMIASCRPTETRSTELTGDADLATFLGQVATEANVTRVHLGPLRPVDVESLVADLPFADVADQLHEKTSGSPLFLTEMIRSFGESGQPATAADGSLLVPGTVQELAISRVDRLGPAHRSVLADAAVLGDVFELADIERLSPPHIDVLSTLEDAERSGIVVTHAVDDEAFIFGHAVVREALYERISGPRRRRRHRAAADAILDSGDERVARSAADVLRHVELSRADFAPALLAGIARSAAENSMRRLDLDEAVRHRELAVTALTRRSNETVEHVAERCEALLALSAAQTSAGRKRGRATFVEAAAVARSIERWDLFSEAASGYGGPLKENQAIVDVSEPAALIKEALEHEVSASATRARLLTALAIWQRQHVPYAERRALTDEALEIARATGDKRTLATVLAEVHRALHGPIATLEALDASEELERLAAELGDDMVAFQALNLRLQVEFELGRVDDADETARRLAQVADRIGTIEGKRIGLLWQSTLASSRGDTEAQQNTIGELSQLLTAYPPSVRAIMIWASELVLPWLQGQRATRTELEQSYTPLFTRAFLAADSGRPDLALRHVEQGGGPNHLVDNQNYLFFHDIFAMTRTARSAGDAALASNLYEILQPLSGRFARMGLVAFLGAVDHHLGSLAAVLGETDTAIERFTAALQQHRQMRARPWIALTLAEFAVVLRDAGDAGHVELAREARSIADELGLGLVLETLDQPS